MKSNTNPLKEDKNLLEELKSFKKHILTEGDSAKFENLSRPKKMTRPNIDSINLRASDRPIDYGHCKQLLVDKYGKERGEKSYKFLFTDSNNNTGWIVVNNIQKEKIAMFRDIKHSIGSNTFTDFFGFSDRPSDLDEVNYFNLWQLWIKLAGKNGNIKQTKSAMTENIKLTKLEEEVVNISLFKDKESIERKIRMVGRLSNYIKNDKGRKFVIESLRTIKNKLKESELKDLAIQICELKESTRKLLVESLGEAIIKLPDLTYIKKIKMFVIEGEEAPETLFIEFEVPFYPVGNSFLEIRDSLFDLNKRFSRLGNSILNQTINWKPDKNPYFTGTGIWEGSIRLFNIKPGSIVNGKGELALDTKVKENPIPFSAYKPAVIELLTNLDSLIAKWFTETSDEDQKLSLAKPKKSVRTKKLSNEDPYYSDEKEFEGMSDEDIDKLAIRKATSMEI